jgi:DNA-binding NtrC family response regulator
MNDRSPHSWPDGDSVTARDPEPIRPEGPDGDDTVIVCDPQTSRLSLLRQIVEDSNLRLRGIQDLARLEDERYWKASSIAVVALGARPSPGDVALEVIRTLKQRGLTVISYEAGADLWPIGARCRALLAGASWVLDSGEAEFAGQLRRRLVQCLRARSDRRAAEDELAAAMRRVGIVGLSEAMLSVFRQVLQVSALSDLPILITGETGTGKELVAQAVHQLDAKRRHGPFVALNCGALSPGLVESELFGHRRGAFTGAERDRKGLIRAADGGVLFLDEVGELADDLQVKLLRVLQERRVLGLGEDHEVIVKVRVVAATNRNLEQLVQQRKFRADLFHRLSVLTISIPPLRERPSDLKPLVEHLVKKYEGLGRAGAVSVSPEFVEALRQIDLPGNVRQVENLIRQALVSKEADVPLTLRDLPAEVWRELAARPEGGLDPLGIQNPVSNGEASTQNGPAHVFSSYLVDLVSANGWSLGQALQHCERVLLEAALHRKGGNQSQTARLLGLTPRSVYTKIRRHQLFR